MISMPRIKQAVRQVKKLFVTPLLLPFALTTEKQAIVSDVRRWTILEINEYASPSELDNLLILLGEYREFRNLYYYRIFQGNMLAIIFRTFASSQANGFSRSPSGTTVCSETALQKDFHFV